MLVVGSALDFVAAKRTERRTCHTLDSTNMDKGGRVEDQGTPAVGPVVDGRSELNGARLH